MGKRSSYSLGVNLKYARSTEPHVPFFWISRALAMRSPHVPGAMLSSFGYIGTSNQSVLIAGLLMKLNSVSE